MHRVQRLLLRRRDALQHQHQGAPRRADIDRLIAGVQHQHRSFAVVRSPFRCSLPRLGSPPACKSCQTSMRAGPRAPRSTAPPSPRPRASAPARRRRPWNRWSSRRRSIESACLPRRRRGGRERPRRHSCAAAVLLKPACVAVEWTRRKAPDHGNAAPPRQRPRQQLRLIEAALPLAPPMQRHRRDGIEALDRAAAPPPEIAQAGRPAFAPAVFKQVDQLAQRAFVSAEAIGRVESAQCRCGKARSGPPSSSGNAF